MTNTASGLTGVPYLSVNGLSKTYGGVHAIEGVSLELFPGQITALIGDNGAGKSTLVKCLSGLVHPDSGDIEVDGNPVQIRSPRHARELGIETVHQELSLIQNSNVAQNLFLNREIRTRVPVLRQLGWLNHRAMRARTRTILDELGIQIASVKTRVSDLSGGQRQCVSIGRAVGWSQRVVMLDEPTAALGVRQTGIVLDLIKRLANRDIAVLVITHNMDHVMQVCDRAVVLRLGKVVADVSTANTTANDLVGYITGSKTAVATTAVATDGGAVG
jgi:simple sugar transport system ATP-binding protein